MMWFDSRSRRVSEVRADHSGGRGPEKVLEPRLMEVRDVTLYQSAGSDPTSVNEGRSMLEGKLLPSHATPVQLGAGGGAQGSEAGVQPERAAEAHEAEVTDDLRARRALAVVGGGGEGEGGKGGSGGGEAQEEPTRVLVVTVRPEAFRVAGRDPQSAALPDRIRRVRAAIADQDEGMVEVRLLVLRSSLERRVRADHAAGSVPVIEF